MKAPILGRPIRMNSATGQLRAVREHMCRGPPSLLALITRRSDQLAGQAASICWAMVATGVVGLLNQLTIDFHSWPAPTAAGIASEASNAKVAVGSARYFADSWSIGSV